jgi:hypothetical protein
MSARVLSFAASAATPKSALNGRGPHPRDRGLAATVRQKAECPADKFVREVVEASHVGIEICSRRDEILFRKPWK